VHYKFVPLRQTVNQHFYTDPPSAFAAKCGKNDLNSELQDLILDDNASAHSTLSVCELLATKKMNIGPHSPYSPDAAL
jgi:hypothetical protein